jgi:outer membrane receptor protein involved in Fe transport
MDFLHKKTLYVYLLILCFNPMQLFSGTTGKIVGTAKDAGTGEPLPGVNVIIDGTSMGAATDIDGTYYIIGIPPGEYTLIAMYISYRETRVTDVEVNVDKTTTINFELEPETLELSESIEVVAQRPLVKKDLTSTEAVIDKEMIEALPVQELSEVVNLQAGVIEGHFRGGRTNEVLYLVNGISVNDVYSNEYAIEIENNSIQELNVISGTFNAEYGRAMSGVVNVVTRDGGQEFEGNISGNVGDYVSSNDDVFWHVDDFNPVMNLQGTLSGPIFSDKLTFFLSGRYYYDSGWLYGSKAFLTSDSTGNLGWTDDDPEQRFFMSHGKWYNYTSELANELIENSESVPMNNSLRYTGNLKLTYRLSPVDKINLEGVYQNREYNRYAGDLDHRFRLNPDGNYNYFHWSGTTNLSWNHIFSSSSFMDAFYSYFYTSYEQYVYDNLYDSRYEEKSRLQDTGANAFVSGGQDMWQFRRSTTTHMLKSDFTSQVSFNHLIKTGFEYRQHRLWMHEYEVIPELPGRIAPTTSFQNNQYLKYPFEFSAYLQDKMEFEDLVINAGIRYDYFEPDGEIPLDFSDPANSKTRSAEATHQFSPRLGLAYPISATGAFHVSYGHFFQVPNFLYLYTNPQFNIDPLQSSTAPPPESLKNTVGNAELKPQQTTIYEIGLQQQLSSVYAITLTVYFKDIRNLLGTEVLYTINSIRYGRYINRDYGYVRGVTFTFERRFVDGIAANIDYTFQISKGNASDPNNAFLDAESNRETEKVQVPLSWDRTHQLNASINFGQPQDYIFSIVTRFGTGFPYTTQTRVITPYVENGGRKPSQFIIDLYFNKNFNLGKFDTALFLRVFNLLDRRNEVDVYAGTGRATYSLIPIYTAEENPRGLNSLDQYLARPHFYGQPRLVQIGLEFNF